jgi:hypothetical protein
MMSDRELVQYFAEAVSVALWFWVLYRRFVSAKPLPRFLAIPGRLFKLCLLLVTLGLLAGCGNGDPLAVASGPLFPLNAGHWQPGPQDLVAPPKVTDQ